MLSSLSSKANGHSRTKKGGHRNKSKKEVKTVWFWLQLLWLLTSEKAEMNNEKNPAGEEIPGGEKSGGEAVQFFVSRALQALKKTGNGRLIVFVPNELSWGEIGIAQRALEKAGIRSQRNGINCLTLST